MFHRVKSEAPNQNAQQPATQPQRPDMMQEPRWETRSEAPVSAPTNTMFKPLQSPVTEQSFAPTAPKQPNPFTARLAPQAQPEQPKAAEIEPAFEPTRNEVKDEKPMTEQDNKTADSSHAEDREIPASAFARTGTAPAMRAPVSAYPGTSYAAYTPRQPEPAVQAAAASDRRLTIGPGITLSGEIESCDYLLVEGTVEAALKGANVLDIAESGVFYGTVEINEATIAGRFEGDIAVSGRLTVTSTGVVTGSIAYKELSVESGAVVDGKLTPMSAMGAAAKKPAKGKPAKDSRADAQDSGGELFSKAAAE